MTPVGARGGRRIPDAVLAVLLSYCGFKQSGEEAIAAPRMHTEGGIRLLLDDRWNDGQRESFEGLGYEAAAGSVAIASAVFMDGDSGQLNAAQR